MPRFAAATFGFTGLAALCLAGCELPDAPPPRAEDVPSAIAAPLQADNAEAAKLYRVVETYFNEYLALNPIFASSLGDHRFDERFGDFASASWMADSLGIEQESLERLAQVDPTQLQGEDLVSYEAFRRQRELNIYGYRYPSELLAISQVANWGEVLPRLAAGDAGQPFRTTADYDAFLARMDGFASWTEQVINNLRAGVSKGVVLPKVVVERTLPSLAQFAGIENPRHSIFWQPLLNLPPGPTVAERRRLVAAYDEKLRKRVFPAYRRLHEYLVREYLPKARETIAWSDLPGGSAWYAYLVRYYTSSQMTPDQVHEVGLREVTRLRANLANLQPSLAVGGDVRTLLEAMRADPKFRAAEGDAALAAYGAIGARVQAHMPELFARGIEAKPVLRAVESYRASWAPAVEYAPPGADGRRPATLYVNTRRGAPRFEMEPAFLHEAVPGHHYQRVVAQDAPNLPSFRRFANDAPYTEGWALYAETLGLELGLYAEPEARFGALVRELLHAALLVVDTGIHARGWTRARAIEYLRANSALGENEIAAVVDRCIAAPAQSLAYKAGELKILELRRRAEAALGARFDPRAFHEQVVGGGSLPLAVLEARIDRWIARGR
ncbi:MAG: DUF885 domain-containing protein [Steroidobacteraceae bacterium]